MLKKIVMLKLQPHSQSLFELGEGRPSPIPPRPIQKGPGDEVVKTTHAKVVTNLQQTCYKFADSTDLQQECSNNLLSSCNLTTC